MEKSFLKVLHKGEIMDVKSLEMLKGGMVMAGCGSLTTCDCYKGVNGFLCGSRNHAKPEQPTKPSKPSTDPTTTIEP